MVVNILAILVLLQIFHNLGTVVAAHLLAQHDILVYNSPLLALYFPQLFHHPQTHNLIKLVPLQMRNNYDMAIS